MLATHQHDVQPMPPTQAMTNTKQINWFVTAGTLRAAFEQDKRQDGTLYWCLTEQARQSVDDLTEWLRGLHDDELPNDWRYETIVSILDALMDVDDLDSHEDHHDLADGIANNNTDIYNADLLQWYADIPSRVAYIDDDNALVHVDLGGREANAWSRIHGLQHIF